LLAPGDLQLEVASAIARCSVGWTLGVDER